MDPVTILKCYQQKLMYGRQLDLTSEAELVEGEVFSMYIDRYDFFQSTVDEVLAVDNPNLRLPLEVVFVGEQASDLGGPRKDFLSLSMRTLRERLFEETAEGHVILDNPTYVRDKHYYVAGLIIG